MEKDYSFYLYKVAPALRIIQSMWNLYPNQIFLSYNGGKDCTVLLELIEMTGLPIPIVYFAAPDDFPELLSFIKRRIEKTTLSVIYKGSDFKTEMRSLVNEGFKATILGQRITDKGCPEVLVSPTSTGWPDLLRILPILEWTYADVWKFIISYGFEYCELYDRGYSSLGPMSSTKPNSLLAGKPAWQLSDPTTERIGRYPKL